MAIVSIEALGPAKILQSGTTYLTCTASRASAVRNARSWAGLDSVSPFF